MTTSPKKFLVLAAVMLLVLSPLSFASSDSVSDLKLVPLPEKIVRAEGSFDIGQAVISCPGSLKGEASYLNDKLVALGIKTIIDDSRRVKTATHITLKTDSRLPDAEAYKLEVSKKGISITGGSPNGVFYGVVTLLQLALNNGSDIPCVTIEDAPRYSWRGFMLDESRHFFGTEKVKQYLDLMAWNKMNVFHWHLTDQSAWRIEIKGWPKLTQVGSTGNYSSPRKGYVPKWTGLEPAMYYTQDEIREIVAYAAQRHIEVIPEIDMPGHGTAANDAYPQFSGGSVPYHGAFTFNPFIEGTYSYLTSILREVAGLFPSQYISIGGDEVSFGRASWDALPEKEAFMRKHSLTDLLEVEQHFKSRIADSIRVLGKKMVGWDELVENNTGKDNVIIQWWRHDKPEVLKRSLEEGYRTILCPRVPCYFDYIQDLAQKVGPMRGTYPNSLEACYNFPDPILGNYKTGGENVIGVQANLWSETITDFKRLDYQVWPRLSAIAEDAWTAPEKKDFDSFQTRIGVITDRLDKEGIYYYTKEAKEPYAVQVSTKYYARLRKSLDPIFPTRSFQISLPPESYADSLVSFVNVDMAPGGFNQLVLDLGGVQIWPEKKIRLLMKACRENGIELVPMLAVETATPDHISESLKTFEAKKLLVAGGTTDEIGQINELVKSLGASLLIWADGMSREELEHIDKSITLCDRHYDDAGQAVASLAMSGFHVIACGWRNSQSTSLQLENVNRFRKHSPKSNGERYQGYMQTVCEDFPGFIKDLRGDLKNESSASNYIQTKRMFAQYAKETIMND